MRANTMKIPSLPKCLHRQKKQAKNRKWTAIKDDQRVMAVILAALSCVNMGVSAAYQPIRYKTIELKTAPASGEADTPAAIATASNAVTETAKETERDWIPSPSEINLFHVFSEGETKTDPEDSLGGQIFKKLMKQDNDWAGAVYGYSGLTPAALTEKIGISKACIIGDYNPEDKKQVADDPTTWIIGSFRNVWFRTEDGDGNTISPYSNIPQIMSLANVYSYYHDPEDPEAFWNYCGELWKASHYYTLVISDIYHCSGCVSVDETESTGNLQETDAYADSGMTDSRDNFETGDAQENGADQEGDLQVDGSGTLQENSGADSEADGRMTGQDDRILGLEGGNQEFNGVIFEPGILAPDPAQGSIDENQVENRSESGSQVSGQAGTAAAQNGQSSWQTDMASAQNTQTTAKTRICPGHVDLTIVLRIMGLEEKNDLFSLDQTGNDEKNYVQDGWQGWNGENRQAALQLAEKDWYLKYGLRTSTASVKLPVKTIDVDSYLNNLPSDLSEKRKNLLRVALNSVGRIPYYWGGKPAAFGYDGNYFGTTVSPDSSGRSLRGLDCSGWISWVYWTATGTKLPYESTTGLVNLGRRISAAELEPGDILVRTGQDAHTVMFLGWTQDGKIQCVHETSGSVNNVTISIRDADWPYYIRLVE